MKRVFITWHAIPTVTSYFNRVKARVRSKPKRYVFGTFAIWFLLNSFALFGEGRVFGGSGRVMDITDGVATPVEGAYVLISFLSTSINVRYPGPKCDRAILAQTDARGVYRTSGASLPEQWPSFSTETNLGTPRVAVYAKGRVTLFELFQLPPRTEKLRAGISMPADLPQTVSERQAQLARYPQYQRYLMNPEDVDAFYLKADVPGLRDNDVVVVKDERSLDERVRNLDRFLRRSCGDYALPPAEREALLRQKTKDVVEWARATNQMAALKYGVDTGRYTGWELERLVREEQ